MKTRKKVFILHDNENNVVVGVYDKRILATNEIDKLGGNLPLNNVPCGPAGIRGRFVIQPFELNKRE